MSRIRRGMVGAAMAAACAVAPAQAATAAADTDVVACEVTYDADPHWGGFNATMRVKNTGTVTTYGWTFVFPLEPGVRVVSFWNAVLETPSGEVTVRNEQYNAVLPPGQWIDLGFLATGTQKADPEWYTVNTVPCAIAG